MSKKTVCIFCGANTGNSEVILAQTKALIQNLIAMDFNLVYGGGKSGLMGLIADQFLTSGKKVIGIRPAKLIKDEDVHSDLTELKVVTDMFERKSQMMERADFFIALPGGVGTLDEILDVYTNTKIGFADKFCALLDVEGFYKGLNDQLSTMVEKSFLSLTDKNLLVAGSPEYILEKIKERLAEIDKVAYIAIDDKRVLTARTRGNDKFYIPGGKRENEESDIKTLTREVKEELSVDLIEGSEEYVGTFRAQAHGKPKGIQVRMTCYSAQYLGDFTPNSEIEEIKWLTSTEEHLVSHVDKVIFRYLKGRGEIN